MFNTVEECSKKSARKTGIDHRQPGATSSDCFV